MNQSKRPIWKKSILENLTFYDIIGWLDEVGEDGDMYGYERGDSGYYNDYKELFDELSAGAYTLEEALGDVNDELHLGIDYGDESTVWDDVMVAMLGPLYTTLGYDVSEYDYFHMVNSWDDNAAQKEAKKRLMRLTKEQLINTVGKVFQIMALFWDLKAAHDCLTAVVDELDYKGAILEEKSDAIDKLYEEYTGKDAEEFEARFEELTKKLPQRMWVE